MEGLKHINQPSPDTLYSSKYIDTLCPSFTENNREALDPTNHQYNAVDQMWKAPPAPHTNNSKVTIKEKSQDYLCS